MPLGGRCSECQQGIGSRPSDVARRAERVRALLDALPDATSSADDAAQARLHETGLLGETRTRATSARARRTPVDIKGKPLSETIVDERL